MENVYLKDDLDDSADELMRFKHTMDHIPKRQVPLFCIMLKINQTEDDFTFTLSPKEFFDLFSSYFTKVLEDLDNISDLESRFLPKYENYQIVKGKIKMTHLPSSKPTAIEIREGVSI